MAHVSLEFICPETIDEALFERIFQLARTSMLVERAALERRLQKCHRFLAYRQSSTGRLVGITTVDVIDLVHRGVPVRMLYTGCVVIDPAYRQPNLIPRAGLLTFLRFGLGVRRRIYWFCECDSTSGYLAVVRNFRNAWPRRERATPRWERGLMSEVCQRLFADTWSAASGLCSPLADLQRLPTGPGNRAWQAMHDPDIAFFHRVNPDHERGVALPVMARLDAQNWLSLGLRVARRQLAQR